MTNLQQLAEQYIATWNETDAAARRKLIDTYWAADATYVDPLAEAAGRDAVDAVIGAVQAQFPGLVFTLGTVDAHHQLARFTWDLGPAGAVDFFIVNVAIPSLQSQLHAGPAGVQWVVAGFGLAPAAALVTAGRLGDRFGRRRMFALGLLLFTLSSAACGLAPGTGTLVAARVLQGLSAALMTPQVLAIVRTAYTGGAQARAFGMYGLTMGIGAVLGQLIGGLLIGGLLIRADLLGLGWRSCFLINVPVGLVVLALVRRCVPESRAPGRTGLDLPGTALVTAALTALVLPLIQGRSLGWPLWTWVCLAASAVLFALFAAHQARLATDPVLDPRLLHERGFVVHAFEVGMLALAALELLVAALSRLLPRD